MNRYHREKAAAKAVSERAQAEPSTAPRERFCSWVVVRRWGRPGSREDGGRQAEMLRPLAGGDSLMGHWKAGPEKPKHAFCWDCSRRLRGRVHARVVGEDGQEHDVHKDCVNGREVVGGSTTLATDVCDVTEAGG